MKKFFAVAVLALALFTAPAFAQVVPIGPPNSSEVPQDEVIAAAKPFVGKWAAVSCQSTPLGIRFSIRVDSVLDQDNGTRLAPVFKLTGIQNQTLDNGPFDFQTNVFLKTPDKNFLLNVANANLLLNLQPTQKQGKIVTSLTGDVQNFVTGDTVDFFVIPDTFKDNDFSYVTPLSMMCRMPDTQDEIPQARLNNALYTTADESDDEIAAALKEFNLFVDKHARDNGGNLDFATFGREAVGQPWFARLYSFSDDPKAKPITWENEGYPTALSVMAAIEANYGANPNGRSEVYGGVRAQMTAPVVSFASFAETDEDRNAVLTEFNKFATSHNLVAAYRDGSKPDTYDVALFVADANGEPVGDAPKWAVYNSATLTEGVSQIESDYTEYPNGHVTGGVTI